MRAADRMVECLAAQGAERIFCVPGESYLSLLDALRDDVRIQTIVCRHEGGAGLMAVADAKLTGRPGVVAVSRGPGATNAAIALHLAEQDAVPLVAIIGQVARRERGRGAFQEVDYGAMFGTVAKAVWEVADANRLPEIIARAWHVAQSDTPGPVVIALPEDMLDDGVVAEVVPPLPVATAQASEADVARVAALLDRAERPLLVAGGALAGAAGRAALARAAAVHQVPVALTFKHQEIFDNASPLFAGHLGFKIPKAQIEALAEADLVLAVGTRLGDTPTQGYTFPRAPLPRQRLVHVYADARVIGRVFRADIGLPCDPASFLDILARVPARLTPPREAWVAQIGARGASTRGFRPRANPDGVDFGAVVAEIAAHAPSDTIVTTDAGNFSGWVHRIWPWDGSGLAIGAAGGAMGLGVPAAVAACLRFPGRRVIGFAGVGGALMTGNELATAAATGAKPMIVIANNGSYGTIRLHQEREFPRRTAATDLTNPDFAAWGAAFGALGLTIARDDQTPAVVPQAFAHDGPVVIDVRTSLEAISAQVTISALRDGR